MEHSHLVETYNKAQHLYNKKKYRAARKFFERVASEIYASDTDCSADIHLCNSSQEYLDEIEELNLKNYSIYWVLLVVVIIFSLLIYFATK
jgi:outer membrane protein assembly factor BamD (BamD/ComL family)